MLVAGGLTLAALALVYMVPPTRGELERTFDEAWAKQTCAASGVQRCRVSAKAVPVDERSPSTRNALADRVNKMFGVDPSRAASRLSVSTNLDADVLLRAGAQQSMWPRMKAALNDAAIESAPPIETPAPASRPQKRKRS